MSQVIFRYNSQDILVPCAEHEPISLIVQKFCTKVIAEKNNLYFICNGAMLNEELSVDRINPNSQGTIIILVYDVQRETTDGAFLKQAETIICPECKESISLTITDYKVSLFGCKNGHRKDNMLLSKFNETQIEDISKIFCGKCQKNKKHTYKNKMHFCTDCKINLCPNCKESESIHDNTHNVIEYDQKKYICEKDGEFFTTYCYTCNKNICQRCEDDHNNHKLMPFSRLLRKKDELIWQNNNLRRRIDEFKLIINNITKKLNKVSENIETYFDINKMLVNISRRSYRNYEELASIDQFNNNCIEKDLICIINECNINVQIRNILKIYEKMGDGDGIQNNNENKIINNNINSIKNKQTQNNNTINNSKEIPIKNNNINLNLNNSNNNNNKINQNKINNESNQNKINNEINQNKINNESNQNKINNESNQNKINNESNQNIINNEINQNKINNESNQNIINNEININNNNNNLNVNNQNINNTNTINNNNTNNTNNNNHTTTLNNNTINSNSNQIQNSATPVGNNNNFDDNNILNVEYLNEIRQNIDNNTPLISNKLDIGTLLIEYRENLEYINSIQIIANKYSLLRKIRRDGNCFYRGFIYRIFEYICITKNNDLYLKFLRKIEEAKDLVKKNTKLSLLIDDPYNRICGEFCGCYDGYNTLTGSNMSSRDYINNLFHDDNRYICNLLVCFIRYSIAEYLRENRLLYEAYIEGNYDDWIEKEVETIDNEADQVQIMACVNLFEIGVKIEYLNKVKNEVIKFPEDKKDEDIFITFLFTPGHYDLLYDNQHNN